MEGQLTFKSFLPSENYLNICFRNENFHVKPLLKVSGCGKSKGLQIVVDSKKVYKGFKVFVTLPGVTTSKVPFLVSPNFQGEHHIILHGIHVIKVSNIEVVSQIILKLPNFIIFRHLKISKFGTNKIRPVTLRKIRSSTSLNTTLRIIAFQNADSRRLLRYVIVHHGMPNKMDQVFVI